MQLYVFRNGTSAWWMKFNDDNMMTN